MKRFTTMTNATKAQIIVVINALLALLAEFGVDFNVDQQNAIIILVNALLALWVGITYDRSYKRQGN